MAKLAVVASGMVTAVGLTEAATCAAMRAKVSGVKQANLWDAESMEYISAARPPLVRWWVGPSKLVEVIAPALEECFRAAAPLPPGQVTVLLGVAPPDRPHRWEKFDEYILPAVQARLGLKFHPASAVLPNGNVAGTVGLQRAAKLFEGGEVSRCIVAGVDTFLEQRIVEAYMAKRRVLTPANSNGFIPGEAGTAVLVAPAGAARGDRLEIGGVGFGRENGTIESEEPSRAEGLTAAVGEALSGAGLKSEDAAYRITDLDGEHYKFKEASIAKMRFERGPREQLFEVWHAHEFLGEIGAAHAPCALGWALHAGRNGYAPGPTVLFHFGNDDGDRAALVARYLAGEKADEQKRLRQRA